MSEDKKLNIYEKLQNCRVGLQDQTIKKSGKNDFSKYEYFELGDFLPHINKLLKENKLSSIFQFTSEKATLTIIDVENIEDKIEFSTPVEVTQLKGCNMMQNIGGTQTFARRYLYVMAFEIAENDILNQAEIDEEAEHKRKKIDVAKVQTLKNLITSTNTNEKEFCKWARVKTIEDITNGNFPTCIKALDQKKEQLKKSNELDGVI